MTDRTLDPVDLLELDPEDVDADNLETFRPSLVKLVRDLRELREELLEGFPSRRDLLFWLQRLAVRSLGELPQFYYHRFGRQFRISRRGERTRQGVLLTALLEPHARDRELVDLFRNESGEIEIAEIDRKYIERIPEQRIESIVVDRVRGRISATMLRPAQNRAYRQLRKEATEHVDEDEGAGGRSAHDPRSQEHPAMRPSLGELESWQQAALSMFLEGFEDRSEIIEWGDVVDEATNGEINNTASAKKKGGDVIQRAYTEASTRRVLRGDGERDRRVREVLAAVYLCPAFNLGVREQLGRAKELPEEKKQTKGPGQVA